MDLRLIEGVLESFRPRLLSLLLLVGLAALFFSRDWIIALINQCSRVNPNPAVWILFILASVWFVGTSTPALKFTSRWMDSQYDLALSKFDKLDIISSVNNLTFTPSKLAITGESRNLSLLISSLAPQEWIDLEIPENLSDELKTELASFKITMFTLSNSDPLVRSRNVYPVMIVGGGYNEDKGSTPSLFHSFIAPREGDELPFLFSARVGQGGIDPRYSLYIECVYQITQRLGPPLKKQVIFGFEEDTKNWTWIDSESWVSDAKAFLRSNDHLIITQPISLPEMTSEAAVVSLETLSDGYAFKPNFKVKLSIAGNRFIMDQAGWLPGDTMVKAEYFFHDFWK